MVKMVKWKCQLEFGRVLCFQNHFYSHFAEQNSQLKLFTRTVSKISPKNLQTYLKNKINSKLSICVHWVCLC